MSACCASCFAALFDIICPQAQKKNKKNARVQIPNAERVDSCPPRESKYLELDNNLKHFAIAGGNETFGNAFELTQETIGSGMNGAVLLARPCRPMSTTNSRRSTSSFGQERLAAVKILRKRSLSKAKVSRLLNEVEVYLKMDHVNIARLLRVFDEDDKIYLVMEYCSGGALCDRLIARRKFSEAATAEAMKQALEAVNYLHTFSAGAICHRDLKHSNFVYASAAEDSPLKLVDFGLSRVLSPDQAYLSSFAGTLHYMAPEVIRQDRYNESCDLWSIGVIAYWLMCGEPPFDAVLDRDTKGLILAGNYRMEGDCWDLVSPAAKAFVASCLRVDPLQRPTASQALADPWLAGPQDPEGCPASTALLKLRGWARQSAMKRATVALMVYSEGTPSCERVQQLQAAFKALDADGDGKISCEELVSALRQTLHVSEEEGQWIFKQIDVDGDMEIHYSEFLAAAMGTMLLQHDDIFDVFRRFDHDQDGQIETAELERVLGEDFCGVPTREIFQKVDKDQSGSVSLEEFQLELKRTISGASEESQNSRLSRDSRRSSEPDRLQAQMSLLRLHSQLSRDSPAFASCESNRISTSSSPLPPTPE